VHDSWGLSFVDEIPVLVQ